MEAVYPDTLPLVTDQLQEKRGNRARGDAQRYVTPNFETHPTSELYNSNFTNNEEPTSRYQTVLNGQDNRDIDITSAEISVPTDNPEREVLYMEGNAQDSDETDSDFSSLNSQPSSLNYVVVDSQSYEGDNQVVTPVDGEDKEANNRCSIEKSHKEENDTVPVDCRDTNYSRSVVVLGNKTVQDTVVYDQPKQRKSYIIAAKVWWRSINWQEEFPLNHEVFVKLDEKEYLRTTIDSSGCLVTLVYEQVSPVMDAGVFNIWEKLDSIVHCGSVVAYLENECFGYIVKEQLENGMSAVVNKIINRQKTTAEDIARFDGSKCTANTMSRWRSSVKEEQRLKQLLHDLVTSVIRAGECLHQIGFVALNIRVSNLFVKFNCDCWDIPSCHHGSSGVTVVIRNCESAYPIDSLVDSSSSKALQLLDPMHKYRRAELMYDNLDVVMVVVKLLTKISGNRNCKKKLSAWLADIANGAFNDPPVEDFEQLFERCGIAHNITIKVISYLRECADHYDKMSKEHEV